MSPDFQTAPTTRERARASMVTDQRLVEPQRLAEGILDLLRQDEPRDGRPPHILVIGRREHPLIGELTARLSEGASVSCLPAAGRETWPHAHLLVWGAPVNEESVAHFQQLALKASSTPPVVLLTGPILGDAELSPQSLAATLEAFMRAGFVYDAFGPASLATQGAFVLRHTTLTPAQAAAYLALVAHHLQQEIAGYHTAAKRQDDLLAEVIRENIAADPTVLEKEMRRLSAMWDQLQASPGYAILVRLQRARARFLPPASRREALFEMVVGWARIFADRGASGLLAHFRGELRWRTQALRTRYARPRRYRNELITVTPLPERPPVRPHTASVDIIVCVHNALEDVQRCLDSVVRWTAEPYRLILVDDGSEESTAGYLADFARQHPENVLLLRSDEATGYTRAANRGLRASTGDFVVLLNSDTIVTEGWLDRMIACAETDPQIGLVGPLSNTASWQSVPQVDAGGDWAENPLPPGMDVQSWARQIVQASGRIHPPMPFLNGFCLMVRRQVMDEIGIFDEEAFAAGYGEENDYCLRARDAGWKLALADDAYVYHAQSRSYSHERRKQLSDRAGQVLAAKHGQGRIDEGVAFCQHARVLEGIRARIEILPERQALIQEGARRHRGKQVLILLPIDSPGGGGNVVITEAEAMGKMGVTVHLFNLSRNREGFQRGYPRLSLPVHYGEPEDAARLACNYDAVIGTWYDSIHWLAQGGLDGRDPRVGYYIQDFEPYFFAPGSEGYEAAMASYTALPDLRPFTKTRWNRQEVWSQVGVACTVVGPSVDIDRFRPLPQGEEQPDAPLRVTAMVRPHSPRRSPELTMRVLRRLSHRYGDRVRITLFGVDRADPLFAPLPQDFDWRLAGVIDPDRVRALLAETDIFVDFSTYQAMGLTALEAMASGAAVIAPRRGGANSFAVDYENALVVDTSAEEACWVALDRLVQDAPLRRRLRGNAVHSVCRFYPEKAAFNILEALFQNV
ncbi:MAG: glycosyltransferase [Caldilineae bacterium]|nr:MAG: glycosyltransferase [Caldilineae bacterium]